MNQSPATRQGFFISKRQKSRQNISPEAEIKPFFYYTAKILNISNIENIFHAKLFPYL